MSCFTYEHRGPGAAAAAVVPVAARCGRRWAELERLADELRADEEAAGLPPPGRPTPASSPSPTPGRRASRWTRCWATRTLSGGDFVRNVKTLIDLLRQIGEVAPDPTTARAARQAADALHRGVVSVSSTLDEVVARRPTAPGRRDGSGRRRRAVTVREGRGAGASPGRLPDGRRRGAQRRRGARRVVERRAGGPASRRPPLGLLGGDLCRTLGGRGDVGRAAVGEAARLPVDLGAVLLDGRLHWFVAHLVAAAVVVARAASWRP